MSPAAVSVSGTPPAALPRRRRRAAAGFTLLELLVAAAITMFLVYLLMTAAQGLLSGYTRTQSNITRQGDLSFALDQLVLDLEGVVIPNAPGAEGLRLSFETVGEVSSAPWLTFLTAAVDADNSSPQPVNGASRAVSYRLAKKRVIDGDPTLPEVYGIYRSIASSAHTFAHALNKPNLQTGYWNALPGSPAPAPPAPTDTANLLAENVISYSVLFQYRDSSGNLVWTRPDDVISIRRDGTFVNNSPLPGGFLRAQVSVTAISPEGAKRLEGGMALDEALKRYGSTVTRQTSFF